MQKIIVLLALGLSIGSFSAPASHGEGTFTANGHVLLPTFGVPIVFGAVNACDPSSPVQGVGGYSVALPAGAPGHPFTLTGTPSNADIVWLTGPQGLSCTGLGYETRDSGMVPARADWGFIVLSSGRNSDVTLRITGLP